MDEKKGRKNPRISMGRVWVAAQLDGVRNGVMTHDIG